MHLRCPLSTRPLAAWARPVTHGHLHIFIVASAVPHLVGLELRAFRRPRTALAADAFQLVGLVGSLGASALVDRPTLTVAVRAQDVLDVSEAERPWGSTRRAGRPGGRAPLLHSWCGASRTLARPPSFDVRSATRASAPRREQQTTRSRTPGASPGWACRATEQSRQGAWRLRADN
ncbi:unnamed protein product [Prorocentrum cordatum]|uniref:Uncharacterized protein n=1 Tax=Prorocentrum cordatum TaxID=2364126 RepID=A0ABN9SG12_9DINO|nr:unnamed protein product [Polarella glacialis]